MRNRIKQLRRAKKMSQKELAARLGTGIRNLGYVEAGNHLSLEMAYKISRILDCTIDEMILPNSFNQDSITSSVQSPENSVEQAM